MAYGSENARRPRFYPNQQGHISNTSEMETLISKLLSIKNRAKLFQLTRVDFVTIA